MIARIEIFLRRLRSRMSRTAWAIRHFKLSPGHAEGKPPGLVLIQIDGFSDTECCRAMAKGNMPHLKRLLDHQAYRHHALYAGLPSSTPGAQGELFYGIKQSVPAFSYYDKTGERIFSMFEGADAREIESRLAAQGEPLLKDGSAYADIFTGGAAESHFCMPQWGWPDVIRSAPPFGLTLLMLLHLPSLVRIVILTLIEFGLAVIDCARGLFAKKDFWRELRFIPSRVGVCIVMREILVIRSAMDLMRGLPIVHLNFLGYDEQSHRRGPDSRFAHWTLKGIDRAIQRIDRAAKRSIQRDYDLWIYSDHGQCRSIPYATVSGGKSVAENIARVIDDTGISLPATDPSWLRQRHRMSKVKRHRPETQPPERPPIVSTLGPLGCITLGTPFDPEQGDTIAANLVRQAKIPVVFRGYDPNHATVWTPTGKYRLPEQATEVLGPDHPHREQTANDMVALCRHPQAPDFFIAGYRLDGNSLTFPNENGAHGGLSPGETAAFALLPDDAPLPQHKSRSLRLLDIRTAAQRFMQARHMPPPATAVAPAVTRRRLRVLTYNIHNCEGLDGWVSPHRIARVIERENADIVALQEVDTGQTRSSGEDQTASIARYLTMYHHFHPAIAVDQAGYGDAVLTRFPLRVEYAAALPYRRSRLIDEPRGALWISVDIGGKQRVQVFNTHFGLWRRERNLQAEALMSEIWLNHPACHGPVILCGDFNSTPRSAVCRRFRTQFIDARDQRGKPRITSPLFLPFPFQRLDHIFVSHHFRVEHTAIPLTHLARMASDHLPLVVDLQLNPCSQDQE